MRFKGHYHEDMLTVEEAREKILLEFRELELSYVSIVESFGMTLADDIVSTVNIPPLDNSAMDGYALVSGNTKNNNFVEMDVIGSISAGEIPNKQITPGKTIRIMTGAPIPYGADSVVPFEDTDEIERKNSGKLSNKITIKIKVKPGENIRLKGEDIISGSKALYKGTTVRSSEIGVAASLGLTHLPVIRRPVVSIISTGNELQSPGTKLSKGKIYNSNAFSIASLVNSYGGIPKIIGIAGDNINELEKVLYSAMEDADLVVTSAGVSKGDYDVVKDVLANIGKMSLWSVKMRPAKPLAFGVLKSKSKKVPHLGLPGNPVSAMVAFIQFGRPVIQKMMGKELFPIPRINAILDDTITNFDGRRVYSRVKVYKTQKGIYRAKSTGSQSSGVLTSMSLANGFAICPEFTDKIKKGQTVQVEMFDWAENTF
ncbi:MAG: molybdopterin molybdenumtransferase MoeA [Chloroflexi bacterium]|nr:molybdopterin molybdenumtransferase MoeA [Chloroflexota bacterium]|tara:strand:- start:5587 stop:6870 length:1284 start_codon:yes stop_codon:yes gene_type:complete